LIIIIHSSIFFLLDIDLSDLRACFDVIVSSASRPCPDRWQVVGKHPHPARLRPFKHLVREAVDVVFEVCYHGHVIHVFLIYALADYSSNYAHRYLVHHSRKCARRSNATDPTPLF
jgi:hypothetical protein